MAHDVPDRGPILVRCMVAFIILTDISVLLRFISRRIARSGYWYDDYMVLLAMLLANGNAICVLVAVHYDFGKHVKDARPDAVAKWYLILYLYENFCAPAVATTKLSVLLFYGRIFALRKFRIQLYALAALIVSLWVASEFVVIFECTPVDWAWTQNGNGHCIKMGSFFIGQAIPNIVINVIMLCVVIPPIWKLQLPLSQKVALSGIFMLGGFVLVTDIYRLALLFSYSPTNPDMTWTSFQVALWSTVEPSIGVVCANLPCLRPIIKPFISGLSTIRSSTKGSHAHRGKAKNTNDSDDFVRLKNSGLSNHENPAIMMNDAAYGVRTEIGGRWDSEAGEVPMGKVHVRKDIDVQEV